MKKYEVTISWFVSKCLTIDANSSEEARDKILSQKQLLMKTGVVDHQSFSIDELHEE